MTSVCIHDPNHTLLVPPLNAVASLPSPPPVPMPLKRHSRPIPRPGEQCGECGSQSSYLWRNGPAGPETLCDTCGLMYLQAQINPKHPGLGSGATRGLADLASPNPGIPQPRQEKFKSEEPVTIPSGPLAVTSPPPGGIHPDDDVMIVTTQVPDAPPAPALHPAPIEERRKRRLDEDDGYSEKKSARQCAQCGTSDTPFWRRAMVEGVLQYVCNACGLVYRKRLAGIPAKHVKRKGRKSR